MAKLLFTPFSIAFSLIAGLVARKVFDRVWHAIDEEEPPDPGEELEPLPRILLAAGAPGDGVRAGPRAVRSAGPKDVPRAHRHLAGRPRTSLKRSLTLSPGRCDRPLDGVDSGG